MQDPVREIPNVIRLLTESKSLEAQRLAVSTYFTADAAFEHPLCAVLPTPERGSLTGNGSREFVLGIYQWYKVLFTNSRLKIKATTFSIEQRKLYVEIDQTVTYKYLPIPGRTVTASLLTVLTLRKGYERDIDGVATGEEEERESRELWYIAKQEDLYQTEEWIKYILPVLPTIVRFSKISVGYLCSVGAAFGKGLKLC